MMQLSNNLFLYTFLYKLNDLWNVIQIFINIQKKQYGVKNIELNLNP